MGKVVDFLNGIGKDKYMHAALSALLCAVLKHTVGLPLAVCVTVAVGIVKEVRDLVSKKGKADWSDMLADFSGTIIGAL